MVCFQDFSHLCGYLLFLFGVYNNRLEGINGTAYYFIDKNLNGFYVSSNFGSDNNLGQIFVSPVNLSNLVLYLTFDEGNGNIVYDYSGNEKK
jgi:hypothetical protein